MKITRSLMGMPITVEIPNHKSHLPAQAGITNTAIERVFKYFKYVDEKYSPFKDTSEVAKANRGERVSQEMKKILNLAEETKQETLGYFDIKKPNGKIDPSGIVKGWAIKNAADILRSKGFERFYIDAGGDTEIVGKKWKWGIRNPFNKKEIVKALLLSDCGIATSGTYERGRHIYNPITREIASDEIVSLTVIGPDVFRADKFATPAFAMGKQGIEFIERLSGFEGYMIYKNGNAVMTSGFDKYEIY